MGLKPWDCIAFEDSQNGLISARKANLETIITINDYTKDHNFADALVVLDSFGDPGLPYRVLQGQVGWTTYLDLDLIRQLHAQPIR